MYRSKQLIQKTRLKLNNAKMKNSWTQCLKRRKSRLVILCRVMEINNLKLILWMKEQNHWRWILRTMTMLHGGTRRCNKMQRMTCLTVLRMKMTQTSDSNWRARLQVPVHLSTSASHEKFKLWLDRSTDFAIVVVFRFLLSKFLQMSTL